MKKRYLSIFVCFYFMRSTHGISCLRMKDTLEILYQMSMKIGEG